MNKKIFIGLVCFFFLNVNYHGTDIEKLKVTASVSDTYSNQIARWLNANNTRLYIEFYNQSTEAIVIQRPVGHWNIFLTLKDVGGNIVPSKSFTFITLTMDELHYVSLNPDEKKVFSFTLSDFGDFDIKFNKLKKIEIEYIPQEHFNNKKYDSLILEEHSAELHL